MYCGIMSSIFLQFLAIFKNSTVDEKMLIILSTGNTDFTKINKIKQNNINFREQLRTRQSSGRVQIQILESEISSKKSSFGVKEDLNSLIIYFSGTF